MSRPRTAPASRIGRAQLWTLLTIAAVGVTAWIAIGPHSVRAPVSDGDATELTAAAAGGFIATVENAAQAPASAPEGMVWIPGGEFSMGAADPADAEGRRRHAGHPRFATGPSRLGRRLLDGPDRGHERPVRRVRQGNWLRHGSRAHAARRGLPRCAARPARCRLCRLLAARSRSAARQRTAMVGVRGGVQTGAIRSARAAPSKERADIRSCTWPTPMRRPMRSGPASGCPPKPSGSSLRAVG